MKKIVFLSVFLTLISCADRSAEYRKLSQRIDSLEAALDDVYKPGFGELMTIVQAHHAKLWFAGKYENWKLADFEVHEIIETLQAVEKFQAQRKETKEMGMIYPPLEKVKSAIEKRDKKVFEESYGNLTETCNTCHRVTDFEYNVVKVPNRQNFANQEFRILTR